ncbi:hypothetical protein SAMN02745146_1918 [Hymenobacter daecheongensis DSM 21074]|uniref:DUF2268 domain-containing protein n=1 Tax=Hymenobacter daecheongensis DSM 21074 TaxID=1121955 RepID=A0A1M6F303_9BACT|nr:DUF5700 domain-containing putative Zn-dependent protease [Hymenobacter daecheongensis]SHI92077.1 hypothetical protein SAMN02745146_1918 [Hymenobacter daecheongensis DSM 21074]
MRILPKIILLLLLLGAATPKAQAQKIDATPLNAYWQLVDRLKQGDSLRVKDWQAFLAIEANKIYIENQGFDARYLANLRKAVEVVYMPQHAAELQERLKEPVKNWKTYKVNQYKAHEAELKQYQQQLTRPEYLTALYKATWEWLPGRLQQRDTTTTIYLLGIENDAIAGGDVMIFTLWSAYNQDKLKPGILAAHEMHHILRRPVTFRNVAQGDQGILYTLSCILNEGSADMIDKKYSLINKDKMPFEFQYEDFLLNKADSIVGKIGENLELMADKSQAGYQDEKYYRNLIRWTSGHCPGYYMADIIVRNGFSQQLLKSIQNPFEFVYLYNKAAKRDKARPYVYSEKAIRRVQELEKKYWLPPAHSRKS